MKTKLLAQIESIGKGVPMDIADKYNSFVGVAVVVLSAIFGQFWYLFALYLLFNILDWLTGWHKANKLHKETSAAGWNGAKKKVWSWVIIAVAFALPIFFISIGRQFIGIDLTFLELLGWFVLATLMVNEARSILENLVECGYPVPDILTKGLAVTEKLINSKAKSIVPEDSSKQSD